MSEELTRRAVLASLLFSACFGCAFGVESTLPKRRRMTRIAARPAGAMSGSAFAAATAPLSAVERQRQAVEELLSGNVPEFLRTLVPVPLGAGGGKRRGAVASQGLVPAGWIWVLPDYLAIGSDEDFLRIPLGLPRALEVARAWDMFLPTRKMVDVIYHQAEVKLRPQPLPPGWRMRSNEYLLRHQQMIEAARGDRPLGALTAGHKKDIVLTKRLLGRADRIAIYGWHRGEGDAIQPLSTVHGARYADYSHGVRLVDSAALYAGEERRLDSLLVDPATAGALSYEGGLPRQLVARR